MNSLKNVVAPQMTIKRRCRRLAPRWITDVYDFAWQSKVFPMTPMQRAVLVAAAGVNRITSSPKAVKVPLGDRGESFWFRPYTSDLQVMIGLHCKGEYDIVRHHLLTAGTVIDLGVNIGASMRLWTQWYPDAHVVGVEPDAANVTLARRNLLVTAGKHLVLEHAAAHDREGYVFLEPAAEPWALRTSTQEITQGVRVKAVTMNQLLDRLPGRRADLLKCDIEGAEQHLFSSCADWIGSVGHILVETHDPYSLNLLADDLNQGGSPRTLLHKDIIGTDVEVGLFAPPAGWGKDGV